MIKKILPSIATVSVLVFGACSTNKLAQQDYNDDVYHSVAQAKEVTTPVYDDQPAETAEKRSDDYVTDSDLYRDEHDEYDRYSFGYANRIHRFHRYSPWRSYYDWYYDPFYSYYNRYPYYSPGWSFSIHVGRPYWYDPFYYDRYYYGYNHYGYGYPYNSYYGYGYPYNRWGIYSYYNSYPGYGIGRTTYASPNYRPRPARGFENITNGGSRPATGRGSVRTDNDGRIIDTRTRAERYGDGRSTPGAPASTGNTRTSTARPTRTETSRPTRSTGSVSGDRNRTSTRSSAPSRPTRTERYTPPPAPSAPDRSSSSGSGRSSSGSSSSSGRPTRGN